MDSKADGVRSFIGQPLQFRNSPSLGLSAVQSVPSSALGARQPAITLPSANDARCLLQRIGLAVFAMFEMSSANPLKPAPGRDEPPASKPAAEFAIALCGRLATMLDIFRHGLDV
jgi:hypothetical protein